MSKRYQVFVSSTYADLKEERSHVIQTLMEMDCIPSGMELFPAVDEEQFEFIKRVIDDCDYYLLIIGGRYGSTTSEGVSYTEKEYDYAIAKGLKVIALLHEDPDSIPVNKTDKDEVRAKCLESFRDKVKASRLIKYWKTAAELPGIVALSLSKTIKTYPAVGWIRGNSAASAEILEELNNLRKVNDELRSRISVIPDVAELEIANIAGLDARFEVDGKYNGGFGDHYVPWRAGLSFGQLFALIAPHLLEHPSDLAVKKMLPGIVLRHLGKDPYESTLADYPFQTLKIQLKALGLIDLNHTNTIKGQKTLCWSLTSRGEEAMMELRSIRDTVSK